jgi:hypothetical protein
MEMCGSECFDRWMVEEDEEKLKWKFIKFLM